MAALWNRAGHNIIFLPCGFFPSSSFFPRLISAAADWMAHSANLECRAEMCCTQLDGSAGPKNRQKFAIWAPSHKLVGRYLLN